MNSSTLSKIRTRVRHATSLPLLFGLLVAGCGDTPAEAREGDSEPDVEQVPCTTSLRCSRSLTLGLGTAAPYYGTHPIGEGASRSFPDVKTGVVVIHGTSRNADDYFDRMVGAAELAEKGSSTVVVAPFFQTEEDGPGAVEPFWTNSGWKRGHLSRGGGNQRVSSYAVLDSVLTHLADRTAFPSLEEIVVAGHSAGGQVVHRYAATSSAEDDLGLPVRYVVANPSTYLYLTEEREWNDSIITPNRDGCPSYNAWHFGLEERNSYADAAGVDSIRARLLRREVVVLLGDLDTGTASLDQSCGANLQGPNRFQRGLRLVRTINALYPSNGHRGVTVPGVGHSSTGMFQSAVGRGVLFGGSD